MLKPRDIIENRLNDLINEHSHTRKILDGVIDEMAKNGFLPVTANDIFTKRKPIEIQSDIVLILFTIALYKTINDESINPNKLFNKNEIEVAIKTNFKSEEIEKFPLVFANVIQVGNRRQWLTTLSAQELIKLINKRVVNYNPETQREARTRIHNGKIITSPKINASSVTQMTDNILKGKQFPNCLTFNIVSNGAEDIDYDAKNYSLRIGNGEIDVIDGWHRLISIVKAYLQNSNVDFPIEIRFENFSIEEAQQFIVQEDKRNPIRKTHIKSIDNNDYSNILTNKLNKESNSILKDKLITDALLATQKSGTIMFDKIMDTIKLTFDPKDNSDVFKYKNFIINGLNNMLENTPELIDNENEVVWMACIVKLFKYYKDNLPVENVSINTKSIESITFNNVNKKAIRTLEERV